MRISELAEVAGVSVATIKFYIRRGILDPGERLAATRADYGPDHVERLRLIKALSGPGGLDLDTVARVIEAVEDDSLARTDLLATAQRALESDREPAEQSRSRAWAAAHGWTIDPRDPVLAALDAAWEACEAAGIGLDEARMDAYAEAALAVAATDLATVPEDPARAVRQVVIGTVMVDPVLAALRRLAQQHLASTHSQRAGER